jgi:hypothetical protein
MDPWWNGAGYLISVQKLAILAVEYLKMEDFQKQHEIPSDIFGNSNNKCSLCLSKSP